MGHFPARAWRTQGLTAGSREDERRPPTATGGPQGGGLSPWWLKVKRHGMAPALGLAYPPTGVRRGRYACGRSAEDVAV